MIQEWDPKTSEWTSTKWLNSLESLARTLMNSRAQYKVQQGTSLEGALTAAAKEVKEALTEFEANLKKMMKAKTGVELLDKAAAITEPKKPKKTK